MFVFQESKIYDLNTGIHLSARDIKATYFGTECILDSEYGVYYQKKHIAFRHWENFQKQDYELEEHRVSLYTI